MANIGTPQREILVEPLKLPIPTRTPQAVPVGPLPQVEPEKVPA